MPNQVFQDPNQQQLQSPNFGSGNTTPSGEMPSPWHGGLGNQKLFGSWPIRGRHNFGQSQQLQADNEGNGWSERLWRSPLLGGFVCLLVGLFLVGLRFSSLMQTLRGLQSHTSGNFRRFVSALAALGSVVAFWLSFDLISGLMAPLPDTPNNEESPAFGVQVNSIDSGLVVASRTHKYVSFSALLTFPSSIVLTFMISSRSLPRIFAALSLCR
jgi:hypothetical protein